MQTIIVTGISGAGKTQASTYLEDLGFYCVDNLPLEYIGDFVEKCRESGQEKVALISDIRSLNFNNKRPQINELNQMKKDLEASILFLDADERTIVRRYQQSRRRHPLSREFGSLEHAIEQERQILENLKKSADIHIDTSNLKPAELYEKLQKIYSRIVEEKEIQLNIISFGFKYGMPESADFIFDARFLPNPFYIEELKRLSGEDQKVRDYVMSSEVAKNYMDHIASLVRIIIPSYLKVDKTVLTIAFGCTGGQHRSVTFAYLLADFFREKGFQVNLEHRDIKKDRERDKYKYE